MTEVDGVHEMFQELRARALITCTRRVRPSENVSNFETKRKVIRYHPEYANLDREILRFIILHEEAHCLRRQNSDVIRRLFYLLAVGSMFAVFLLFRAMGYQAPTEVYPVLAVLIIAFTIFSPSLFESSIHEDEYYADLNAAETLRTEYHVHRPSSIVRDALKAIQRKDERSPLHRRFDDLTNWRRHPPVDDRVDCVRQLVDES